MKFSSTSPMQLTAFHLSARAQSRRASVEAWFDQVRAACGAFEWVTLAYLGWLIAVIFLFRKNLPTAPLYLLTHCCIAAGVVVLAWSASRWDNPFLRFCRYWYFLPLWLFLFEELTGLVHLIFPGWFDSWLIQFDRVLTGVYPWDWLAQFESPARNDFMQVMYMTYFPALVVLPGILYGKREWRAFWAVLTSMALAHYTVYVTAVLLPIESPYHAFAMLRQVPLAGGPATWLMDLVERFGRVHGAAFPSAHVAGAFAALLGAWRYRRWLFWVHLPLLILMIISTVYGRYHYLGDGLAGLLVGFAGFYAGHWLMNRRGALPEIQPYGASSTTD